MDPLRKTAAAGASKTAVAGGSWSSAATAAAAGDGKPAPGSGTAAFLQSLRGPAAGPVSRFVPPGVAGAGAGAGGATATFGPAGMIVRGFGVGPGAADGSEGPSSGAPGAGVMKAMGFGGPAVGSGAGGLAQAFAMRMPGPAAAPTAAETESKQGSSAMTDDDTGAGAGAGAGATAAGQGSSDGTGVLVASQPPFRASEAVGAAFSSSEPALGFSSSREEVLLRVCTRASLSPEVVRGALRFIPTLEELREVRRRSRYITVLAGSQLTIRVPALGKMYQNAQHRFRTVSNANRQVNSFGNSNIDTIHMIIGFFVKFSALPATPHTPFRIFRLLERETGINAPLALRSDGMLTFAVPAGYMNTVASRGRIKRNTWHRIELIYNIHYNTQLSCKVDGRMVLANITTSSE